MTEAKGPGRAPKVEIRTSRIRLDAQNLGMDMEIRQPRRGGGRANPAGATNLQVGISNLEPRRWNAVPGSRTWNRP